MGRAKGIKKIAGDETLKQECRERKRRLEAAAHNDARITANVMSKMLVVAEQQTEELEERHLQADFWPQAVYDPLLWTPEQRAGHVATTHKCQWGVFVNEKPKGVISVAQRKQAAWDGASSAFKEARRMREEERAKVTKEVTQASTAAEGHATLLASIKKIAGRGVPSGGAVVAGRRHPQPCHRRRGQSDGGR